MSAIYWHGEHTESRLRGSERAYAGVLCADIAMPVISTAFPSASEPHPLTRIIAPGVQRWPITDDRAARTFLGGWDNDLFFDGERHEGFATVLNTVIATASPALCLLARLHGGCELHAWVAEEDRDWLAGVIEDGRRSNIFRPEQGWEDVIEHLRNGDGGPVVTSYSVTDSFPSAGACNWMDTAWPAEMVASRSYDYNALTDDQKQAVDDRGDAWYDLDVSEQWRLAMDGLRQKKGLQITPENLTTQGFMSGKSLWDAVQSDEWHQRGIRDATGGES